MERIEIPHVDSPKTNLGYNLKLDIITPLYIGGTKENTWEHGFDYFYEDKNVLVVNRREFFQLLVERKPNPEFDHFETSDSLMDQYLAIQSSLKSDKLLHFIRDSLSQESHTKPLPLQKLNPSYYFSYFPGWKISPFVRNGLGSPYIPGSSLKGAIRSALFHSLKGSKKYEDEDENNKDRIEELVLGRFSSSHTRYLQISDVMLASPNLTICEMNVWYLKPIRANEFRSFYKKKFKTESKFKVILESLTSIDSSSNLRINVLQPFLELLEEKVTDSEVKEKIEGLRLNRLRPTFHRNDPLSRLFCHINRCTYNHLNRELQFFSANAQNPENQALIQLIQDELLPETKMKDSCLLRIGQGAGFHSTTGDWRFEDHLSTLLNPDHLNINRKKGPTKYKTRKIIQTPEGPRLMGFIRLSQQPENQP